MEVTNPQAVDCELPEMVGPDAVSLSFEVSAGDGESPIFQRNFGRITADCDDWLVSAFKWFRWCDSHAACKVDGSFYPTRLIDLTDKSTPKLVSGSHAAGDNQSYVVLSYVWGSGQTYTLKTENQAQLCRGLDMTLVARTIKDAFEVTVRLGFHYIWVDALCIIQDSPDDLASELPQMANIYEYGALTIAAASANSSDEGFLHYLEQKYWPFDPVEVHLSTGGDRPISILLGNTEGSPITEPIMTRAWTVQEFHLSRRKLIFGISGVEWECIYSNFSFRADNPNQRSSPSLLSVCSASETRHEEIYTLWEHMRLEYSSRGLTFAGDKLNAIGAVASKIAQATGWTYVAGLWKEHLTKDLLWAYNRPDQLFQVELDPDAYPFLKSAKARDADRVAPSWSWARVIDGPTWSAAAYGPVRTLGFEVLDCQVELGGAGPFGSVKCGILDVKGRLVELGFRRVMRPFQRHQDPYIELVTGATRCGPLEGEREASEVVAKGFPDPLDEPLLPTVRFSCLVIGEFPESQLNHARGLMLLPDAAAGFQRVGYFEVRQPSIFEGVSETIMRIR
ncbi:heterokaryon incompatibility protein-domain-containing protein [Aspergillus carlsbadensis]|nr:heterokaryon incompatibility protein-domain-containing protein [Aspergillus carlsbadensis]